MSPEIGVSIDDCCFSFGVCSMMLLPYHHTNEIASEDRMYYNSADAISARNEFRKNMLIIDSGI